MMIVNFGSTTYMAYLVLSAAIILAIYYLGKDKPDNVKYSIIWVMAIINVTQHLFKFAFWPHRFGASFNIENTAYNVCASLIILTPFLIRKRSGLIKEFLTYFGTIGPSLALIIPFWFFGNSAVSWEFLRFYVCHFLLIATSLLPALWGMVQFKHENFYKIGYCFFGLLIIILMNNIISVYCGLTGYDKENLYFALNNMDPFMLMHPIEFPFLMNILKALSPNIFFDVTTGYYMPVFWYFAPMYLFITLCAYTLTRVREAVRRRGAPPLGSELLKALP